LANYPQMVAQAAATLELAALARYALETAQSFSDFYNQVPILQGERELAPGRLALAAATGQVLENVLSLLGIETVREM